MDVETVTTTAKGITDYGALVIIGAVYIVLSAVMMVAMFKWFKTIIDRIIEQQQEMKPVIEAIHDNGTLMKSIVEGLRPETQLRIRNLTGFAFDLSVENVCRLIKRIRKENHIDDKDATAEKIRKALRVVHDDRNSKFDPFTYNGKPLSCYCSEEWIEQVANVVEGEIYHVDGENNSRAYTNVKLAYDDIKTDFYNNLTKG